MSWAAGRTYGFRPLRGYHWCAAGRTAQGPSHISQILPRDHGRVANELAIAMCVQRVRAILDHDDVVLRC